MKRINDISIRTKLTVLLILIIIGISLLISLSSYTTSKNVILKQVGQLVSTTVEQIMRRTDLFLRNTHNIAISMTYNDAFNQLLLSDQLNYTRDFGQISKFIKDTAQLSSINSYFESIYVYDLRHMILYPKVYLQGQIAILLMGLKS